MIRVRSKPSYNNSLPTVSAYLESHSVSEVPVRGRVGYQFQRILENLGEATRKSADYNAVDITKGVPGHFII